MAYISPEKTKEIRNELKKQFPRKEGWKFSVRNDNHTKIYINILEAPVRFNEKDYIQINYYYTENYENSETLKKIVNIANGCFLPEKEQNFDESVPMTDYFRVGWYIGISQGDWDKPFKLIEKKLKNNVKKLKKMLFILFLCLSL